MKRILATMAIAAAALVLTGCAAGSGGVTAKATVPPADTHVIADNGGIQPYTHVFWQDLGNGTRIRCVWANISPTIGSLSCDWANPSRGQ